MSAWLDFPRGTALVITTDGIAVTLHRAPTVDDLRRIIKADALDVVRVGKLIPNDVVMYVDDLGLKTHKPINEEATKLYLAICIPGATGKIAGDVVLVHDEDLA